MGTRERPIRYLNCKFQSVFRGWLWGCVAAHPSGYHQWTYPQNEDVGVGSHEASRGGASSFKERFIAKGELLPFPKRVCFGWLRQQVALLYRDLASGCRGRREVRKTAIPRSPSGIPVVAAGRPGARARSGLWTGEPLTGFHGSDTGSTNTNPTGTRRSHDSTRNWPKGPRPNTAPSAYFPHPHAVGLIS